MKVEIEIYAPDEWTSGKAVQFAENYAMSFADAFARVPGSWTTVRVNGNAPQVVSIDMCDGIPIAGGEQI